MVTMETVMFSVGAGLGVVFATACCTGSHIYHNYIQDKQDVARRIAERDGLIKEPRLPEPKILYIEHKA